MTDAPERVWRWWNETPFAPPNNVELTYSVDLEAHPEDAVEYIRADVVKAEAALKYLSDEGQHCEAIEKAIAAEREACAKVAARLAKEFGPVTENDRWGYERETTAKAIADAIRARGDG